MSAALAADPIKVVLVEDISGDLASTRLPKGRMVVTIPPGEVTAGEVRRHLML